MGVRGKSDIPHDELAQLPREVLEDMLQQSVQRYLKNKGKRYLKTERSLLSGLRASSRFVTVLKAMQPPIADVAKWIRETMEEVEVYTDSSGEVMLSRKAVDLSREEDLARHNDCVDAFIESLPQDALTGEEEELLELLKTYLHDWTEDEAPLLTEAINPHDACRRAIFLAKIKALPRSVRLVDWIPRRVDGHIDVWDDGVGYRFRLVT